MQNIDEIENLIKIISKLPGLGPKSAKRIILKLINNKENMVKPLARSLAKDYKNAIVSKYSFHDSRILQNCSSHCMMDAS